MDNIVAIIQARTGSSRLPNKIFKDIEGKPMLWHVVDRLKSCGLLNKIVVATTTNINDDSIENFCNENKIAFYRGSESDVLDRYYQAAGYYNASAFVRITSDCPLIDPAVVDKTVEGYLNDINRFDGSSNVIIRSYPRGLDTEVFSFQTLEKCWKQAKKEYHREHVTIYIHEHLNIFAVASIQNKEDLSYLRWTVDEEADLSFVREVYKVLYPLKKTFLMDDILPLLKMRPELETINKHIKQKAVIQK